MLRRFVLALADSSAAANKAVAVLWDASERDFTASALQPLAEAVVGSPHASKLSIRSVFAARAAEIGAAVRRPPHPRDPLFDVAAFWVVADAVTGDEQVAWAVDRIDHFAKSLWVGKSPLPALCGLDILAHVQPRSEAVMACLRQAVGVWSAEVRVKAVLQLLVSGEMVTDGHDVLVRTALDASADLPLRLAAWGRLAQHHGGEPFMADVGSTVLCQSGCPPPLALTIASSLPAKALVTEALDTCIALPGLPDRVRRDVVAERWMWRRGLNPSALHYDGSWTLQLVAAFTGQVQFLPHVADLLRLPVATTSHGWTLLHCAASGATLGVVKALAANSGMAVADADGAFPDLNAAQFGLADALDFLLATLPKQSPPAALWGAALSRGLTSHIDALVSARIPVERAHVLRLLPLARELVVDGSHVKSFAAGDALQVVTLHCDWVDDDVVSSLPASVEELDVSECKALTGVVHFGHLPRLRKLNVRGVIGMMDAGVASLPASVEQLDVTGCSLTSGVRFGHLPGLQSLSLRGWSSWSSAVMVSVPVGLETMDLSFCKTTASDVRFSHLVRLRKLDSVMASCMTDGALLSLPPSIEEMNISSCNSLTCAMRLDHLTHLRRLLAGNTSAMTDEAVALLPASLQELSLARSYALTGGVRFNHLPHLRKLAVQDVAGITDAVVSSLPASVQDLNLASCTSLTPALRFGHLVSLTRLVLGRVAGITDVVVASLPTAVQELNLLGCLSLSLDLRFSHLPHLQQLTVDKGFEFADRAALEARGCEVL